MALVSKQNALLSDVHVAHLLVVAALSVSEGQLDESTETEAATNVVGEKISTYAGIVS